MNTLGFVASIHGNDTLRFRRSHSYVAQGRGAEYCSSMKRIRMGPIQVLMLLGGIGIAASQSAINAIVTNLSTANWTHEKGAEACSEGVMLHAVQKQVAGNCLYDFRAAYVIAPHFYDSNERVIVVEGQLTLRRESGAAAIDIGGFAFLSAREVQRLSRSSKLRCAFYFDMGRQARFTPR
jgi:hypothetical protein